ncbi:MAG: hypothetical protein IJ228_12805 [Succinivibrio sp.]|nr:hypothetical protein [Succinivibrio sp.]
MKGYEFKCFYPGWGRKVYRVIRLREDLSLDDLCLEILSALEVGDGWEHLYEFILDTKYHTTALRFPCPHVDKDYLYDYNEDGITTDIELGKIGLFKGLKCMLHYDFGDNIMIMVNVTKVLDECEELGPTIVASKGEMPDDDEFEDDY